MIIKAGIFHRVDLSDPKWPLHEYRPSIIGDIEFSNRGMTPRRAILKCTNLLVLNK